MSSGSTHKDLKPTAARLMTVLSCAAVLLSIAASGPGQKPLPGTRTAFELLDKGLTRTLATSSRSTSQDLGSFGSGRELAMVDSTRTRRNNLASPRNALSNGSSASRPKSRIWRDAKSRRHDNAELKQAYVG